ncbi:MAG: Rne/Rng family ribonuclease [Candidatus Nucleicultricaceae bacterium]
MAKKMLIDATHPEETRVGIVDENNKLSDYDFESTLKKALKGNIYLAKVARVEPSLQAAFIDYGGDRHGFLAFNEIHPDYFRIPISDRQNAEKTLAETIEQEELKRQEEQQKSTSEDPSSEISTFGGELDVEEEMETNFDQNTPSLHRLYKIQEVIKKNQVILVQVTKEERGGKGAALTTYISMAGRYCVLMPNSPNSGGISRKIASSKDRKRLREILDSLNTPEGMGLIIRTAGMERSKVEIKRDAEYLMRTWNEIRKVTLDSIAPCLIYQEDEIIKRAIRDLYSKDVDQILVQGEEGYKVAKNFMKTLMPSHGKRVQLYKDDESPLFFKHRIERQIDEMHMPMVRLPSGGSIVIHPTEALVSIDINSGRSTKERHIEETAFKTNLEAADEIYRQVRLRDLAGLIVIDFIDMDNAKNTAAVEKRIRDIFRTDRARVQIGKISAFGLLEISRQRLKASILETAFTPCAHCAATGYIRSVESTALMILRVLEEEGYSRKAKRILIKLPPSVAFYILNQKRKQIADIENRHAMAIELDGDESMHPPQYNIVRLEMLPDATQDKTTQQNDTHHRQNDAHHRQNGLQKSNNGNNGARPQPSGDKTQEASVHSPQQHQKNEGSSSGRRRRRRRSGSNRHNEQQAHGQVQTQAQDVTAEFSEDAQLQKKYDQSLQTAAEKEANFLRNVKHSDHSETSDQPRGDSNGGPGSAGRNRRRRNLNRNLKRNNNPKYQTGQYFQNVSDTQEHQPVTMQERSNNPEPANSREERAATARPRRHNPKPRVSESAGESPSTPKAPAGIESVGTESAKPKPKRTAKPKEAVEKEGAPKSSAKQKSTSSTKSESGDDSKPTTTRKPRAKKIESASDGAAKTEKKTRSRKKEQPAGE